MFFSSCNSVKYHGELLNYIDIPVKDIHGKQKQQRRTSTFFEFCEADKGILLCTDVAARGLDIPGASQAHLPLCRLLSPTRECAVNQTTQSDDSCEPALQRSLSCLGLTTYRASVSPLPACTKAVRMRGEQSSSR